MNIHDKIEEIRQKPEHIKIRYVWGSVIISMIFIIIIWIFSFQDATPKEKLSPNDSLKKLDSSLDDLGNRVDEVKNTAPSLESVMENISKSQSQPQSEIGQ